MVKIYPPPPSREIAPQYYVIPAGTILKRIFDPTSYGAQRIRADRRKTTGDASASRASGFRYNGPRSRFDHHSRVDGKPADSPNRGIIYAGYTLSCCLVEIFGDEDLITIGQHKIATIELKRSIKLLDLRGSGCWNAGLNTTIANNDRRTLTQEWSKYFYETPEKYGNIEGIIFSSAKNGEDALAFYERAKIQITSAKISTQSLKDKNLRKEIHLAAKKLHLPIQFV